MTTLMDYIVTGTDVLRSIVFIILGLVLIIRSLDHDIREEIYTPILVLIISILTGVLILLLLSKLIG